MAAFRSMSFLRRCNTAHINSISSIRKAIWGDTCCSKFSQSTGCFVRCMSSTIFVNRRQNSHDRELNVKFPCPVTNIFHVFHRSYSQKPLNITDDVLKSNMSSTSSQDSGDKTSDSKKEKDKDDSWFSGKHAWKLGLLSLFGMSVLMCGNMLIVWGAPTKDEDGNEITDEFMQLPKWQAYPKRAWKEFHFFKKMIQNPSSQKLLPDPLQEPYYQPPYTLVLELTGVLVHPDWTLSTGWRFKKRPAIDYFLQQVGPPVFEVVIYTHEQGFTAFPIIDGLDQKGYVSYRLFRDATSYEDGTHIKDLDCLNRDLSKVLIVDCDPKATKKHPRNAVRLKKWTGNDEDRTLIDLAHFLRTIAASGVEDIRTVIDHYSQYDDPIEAFKQNQLRLQEELEREAQQSKDSQEKKSLAGAWSFGLTGRRR